MLGQVRPTDFDLYFPVGKIPVRVLPWFWLCAVITGFSTIQRNPPRPDLLLIWFGVLFVSILIHELGHAWTGQAFGWPSRVFLYHFGGVAVFPDQPRWTPAKWVAVSLAGPAAGFIFYGVVLLAEHQIGTRTNWLAWDPVNGISPALFAILQLKWVNLWWGLVNLLPVYPLDGGQVLMTLLQHKQGRRGMELACKIGIGVGLAAAAFMLSNPNFRFGGYLFLFLSLGCYQQLQMIRNGYW